MSVCNNPLWTGKDKRMNTRERIIAHSFNLFLNRGYASVHISHILKDLELSRGGFYHHFRNKEEVLKEVIEKYYINQLSDLTQVVESAKSFKEIIIGLQNLAAKQIDIFLSVDEEKPNHYYLMFEAMRLFPETKETISHWYVESIKRLRSFIEKCVAEGELKEDVEPSMLALQIITQVEGLFVMSHFVDKSMDKEDILLVFDRIYNNTAAALN